LLQRVNSPNFAMATASGNNTHATGNLYQHSAQQYPPPLQPHQNVAYGTSADDAKTAHVASGAIVPVIAQQQPVTHWSTPQPAHQHQHYHDHGEIRGLTPVETNDVKRSMFDPLAPSKQQIQSQQIPQLQQQGQTLNVHQQMPISMSGAPFTSTHFGESSVLVASGIQQQHFSGIVQQSQQPQPHPSQKALQWNPQPSPPQITDSADHDPFGIFGSENPPTKTSFTASQQPSPAPPLKEIQTSNSDIVSVVSRSSLEGSSSRIEDESERQLQPPTTIYEQNHTNNSEDYAPPPPPSKTSTYSAQLAQTAPPNASPLPSYSAVRHSGFVLSRISFRSILLKKWKQTFWIQYGPHKLLFFRSISDYDDWLYNPYHTKTQRDFLVKFEVDFVTDLSKATIKGYQVSGVRLKAYNRKIMRQFKLERWMEYGPTIAAAFASTETLEVENLRRCIMELINASQNSLYSSASDHYDNERDLHESSGQPNQGK